MKLMLFFTSADASPCLPVPIEQQWQELGRSA